MGRKRRPPIEKPAEPAEPDPNVRLIATSGALVAVACGTILRVYDSAAGKVCHTDDAHSGAIRGLAFSPDGALLLTAADDKAARVLSTADWSCVTSFSSPKRMSAATFSSDGEYAIVADKYGDVLVVPTRPPAAQPAAVASGGAPPPAGAPLPAPKLAPGAAVGVVQAPAVLLGHLCAIVTSLTAMPGGRLLVSTDKDAKVRASVMPAAPMTQASWEVAAFCQAHTAYVTCSAALAQPDGAALMASGGGDGIVCLWRPDSGSLVASYVASVAEPSQDTDDNGAGAGGEGQLEEGEPAAPDGAANGAGGVAANGGGSGEQAGVEAADAGGGEAGGEQAEEGGEEEGGEGGREETQPGCLDHWPKCAPVLALAASPDSSLLAVLVDGAAEVQLLAVDPATQQLACSQRLALPGVAAPCSLAFDRQGQLWVAGGPPLPKSAAVHLAVAVPAPGGKGRYLVASEEQVQAEARAQLECRSSGEEEEAAAAAAAAGGYSAHLRKPTYDEQQRSSHGARKKLRSSHAETARLEAMAAAHAEQMRQQGQQQGQQQKEQQGQGQQAGQQAG